jgi:hypothetical protein
VAILLVVLLVLLLLFMLLLLALLVPLLAIIRAGEVQGSGCSWCMLGFHGISS